jgi:hypothetical protein
MLVKCATCNKTFIRREADETECPGCVSSGPTRDLAPVAARKIPDPLSKVDPTLKSPVRLEQKRDSDAQRPPKGFALSMLIGIVMVLSGSIVLVLRHADSRFIIGESLWILAGVFAVLKGIYDGARPRTAPRTRSE